MEIYNGDTKITSLTVENEIAKVTVSEGSIVIENKGANENARPINFSIGEKEAKSFLSAIHDND